MPPALPPRRRPLLVRIASIVGATVLVAAASRAVSGTEVGAAIGSPDAPARTRAELVNVPVVSNGVVTMDGAFDPDSLSGRSGHLRVRLLAPGDLTANPALLQQLGENFRTPGIHTIGSAAPDSAFRLRDAHSLAAQAGEPCERLPHGILAGRACPGQRTIRESRRVHRGRARPAETRLSTHFTLRDFLTHDQEHVWPKYVVVREELIDKLELVLDALRSFGVATQHVVVLSGFRSPQYNARGVGEGMARASRHQFGDAADLIIDANHDGRMDDLNHDGVVNFDDTQVIDRAVGLVEHKYPDLVGGLGLYRETGPSGPFVHIDVRGTKARWSNRGWRAAAGPAIADALARRDELAGSTVWCMSGRGSDGCPLSGEPVGGKPAGTCHRKDRATLRCRPVFLEREDGKTRRRGGVRGRGLSVGSATRPSGVPA